MLAVGLVAAVSVVAVIALLALARQTARHHELAREVDRRIAPYLRRRAAEAGLAAEPPIWTRRSRPEEVIGHAAALADELLARERNSGEVPTATDPALALTVPLRSDGVPLADAADDGTSRRRSRDR